MSEQTRQPVTWAGSRIVERIVRAFAEDMHRRGLFPELSEKSCSRATAALAQAFGDPNLSALEQKLSAAEQTPPLGLPAVLASVDDVGRVCEAAGLTVTEDAYEDPAAGIGDYLFVRVEPGITVDRLSTVTIYRQGADDGQEVATLYPGSPTALLWSAIQAARGGEFS